MVLLAACGGGEATSDGAARLDADPRPDVVLLSLDTVRDDAVDPEAAPTLTALAARGVRFAWALSHAPTTAASHASLFTGHDLHGHGVARNGVVLPSRTAGGAALPTLAERFAAAGWETAGVVGASVLDGKTGIHRGFGRWDASFRVARSHRHEDLADGVTDRALEVARTRDRAKPLFLFVHYYDAHGPYDAPAPWTTRWVDPGYAGPFDGSPDATRTLADALRAGTATPADLAALRARYRGEVSWIDAQISRLLAGLALRDNAIVAVVGDHGEVLGEISARPIGHGSDVDLVATHVPMILAGGIVPRGQRVEAPVGTSDLGTTLLVVATGENTSSRGTRHPTDNGGANGGDVAPRASGTSLATAPLGDGRDLTALWTVGSSFPLRDLFLEATQPADRAADPSGPWPNLALERGVVRGNDLLLMAPWLHAPPLLFRVAAGQPLVEAPDLTARRGTLLDALHAWDARAPGGSGAIPELDAALEALGYKEPVAPSAP